MNHFLLINQSFSLSLSLSKTGKLKVWIEKLFLRRRNSSTIPRSCSRLSPALFLFLSFSLVLSHDFINSKRIFRVYTRRILYVFILLRGNFLLYFFFEKYFLYIPHTCKQLSRKNIKLFFQIILPLDLSFTLRKRLKKCIN